MLNALIVDDDPLFRQILKEILASRFPSVSVIEAAHGAEALRKLNINRLDLVFMDIKLPEMNGLELTKKIKEAHPGISVIIVTNHDTPQYRQAALDCSADYFISKASSIEEEIKRAVQSASASRNKDQ